MTSTAPKPTQDLYRHVNGEWMDSNTIPADRGTYGAFMELHDQSEIAVHDILKSAAQDLSKKQLRKPISAEHTDDGAKARIGALYAAMMDEETIEALGVTPLWETLDEVSDISSTAEFLETTGKLEREGVVGGPVGTGAMPDAGNPERVLLHMIQSGLGLPDESYYREEKFSDIVEAYRTYVETLFLLSGLAPTEKRARKMAKRVIDLETKIAEKHWDIVSVRDAVKRYNLYDRDTLLEKFPSGIHWLTGMNMAPGQAHENRSEEIVVWQPDFLTGLEELLDSEPIKSWRTWLKLHIISSHTPFLSDDFVQANFEFSKVLSGTEELRPRWKRAVGLVNSSLGEDVGRLYVAQHYTESHRADMDKLVDALQQAYHASISELPWMGEETRQRALEKLAKFNPMVGYPVKWHNYSDIAVDASDLVATLDRISAHDVEDNLSKIEKGPDPEEWHMSPQTVNAYYSPLENAIVFPAAILQPPFFSPDATPAQNFGGIGAVIGHEIGHGFDDQGSQYDGDGALNDWWTDEDRAAFTQRTESLVDQYKVLAPTEAPEHNVNGELTLGENIGDLGGLGISHKALYLYLEQHPEAVTAQGLDPNDADDRQAIDRQFFESWASVWRQLIRPEAAVTRVSTDPHSPNEFRSNQVVKNLDAFHAAYGTTPEDEMWLAPAERVTIW
ncbi:MAG: M13 family metallopeptidase [Micrococcaceae bacterium]|nr:M13 family metallopeptidase [Micrococcaceae bacterium]